MTINITPIDINSNSWGDLINRLNQIINFAATNAVTAGGNATPGIVNLDGVLNANVANILSAAVSNLSANNANIDVLTSNTINATGAITHTDPGSASIWQTGVSGGYYIKNSTGGGNTNGMKFSTNGTVAFNVPDGHNNHPSVAMSVVATDKGFLPPLLTTAQRNAISNPTPGILVYDTTVNQIYFRNNNQWAALMDSAVNEAADMKRDVYDPEGINGNAFSFVNFTNFSNIPVSSGLETRHAYTETTAGVKHRVQVTTATTQGTIPLRITGGALPVGTPTGDTHATTKLYVDTAVNVKANSAVSISAGTGLTGGGTLAANRTIALSSASIASLAKADTAVQPGVLGNSATRNVGTTSGTVAAGDDSRIVNAANTSTVTSQINSAVANLVTGPASATANAIPIFNGTTGKIVANSGTTIAGVLSRANHTGTQAMSTIDGLTAALAGKQNALGYVPINKTADSGLGGYTSLVYNLGESSGRNITLNPELGNFQILQNTGNFTLTAPTGTGRGLTMLIVVWGVGNGALTASGFTKVEGTLNPSQFNFLTVKCINTAKVLTIEEAGI